MRALKEDVNRVVHWAAVGAVDPNAALELLAELENEFGPREAEDSGGLAKEPAIPVELQELLKDESLFPELRSFLAAKRAAALQPEQSAQAKLQAKKKQSWTWKDVINAMEKHEINAMAKQRSALAAAAPPSAPVEATGGGKPADGEQPALRPPAAGS